ncbi:MAG TPA: DUF2505 domain-containing protein [Nevskiaceae bacterium]|nr:DUF2505 domain-containing protein [Nevskiaceae bacterium]
MKFEEKHAFDQPASTVMKMYADKAFFDRKYKDVGAIEAECLEHEVSDTRFRIKYRLVYRNDAPLPEVAKKIMGDTIQMVQQDTWDLVKKTGRLDIEMKGKPLKLSADMVLADVGGKGVNTQSWNISCSVPLVGGRIEAAVAEDIKVKAKRDLAASRKIILDYV